MKVILKDGSILKPNTYTKTGTGTRDSKTRSRGESRTVKFSKRKIEELIALVLNLCKRLEFTSAIETGVTLVVYYPSGKCMWRLRQKGIEGVAPFYTIGPYPAISIELSHEIARKRKARIAQGLSPDEVVEEVSPTVEAFVNNDFLAYAERKYRSVRDVKGRLKHWVLPQLGGRDITLIRKVDVVRWHEKIRDQRSNVTANRSLSLLSSICTRAVDLEVLESNPCRGVSKFPEGDGRDRVLSDDELSRVVKVLMPRVKAGKCAAQAIYLALTTAKRRSEVLGLEWSRINLDERFFFIPGTKTKNKKYDRVELNSLAHALLTQMYEQRNSSSDYVFPSRGRSGHLMEVRGTFRAVLKEAKIEKDTRFHDLRRTAASLMINAGASIYEVKEVLSHTDISSTQVYARLAQSTVAKASELAAKKIEELLNA